MEYCVIFCSDLNSCKDKEKFEREISSKLNDGWQLHGGISITDQKAGYEYKCRATQSLIKDNK